MQMILYHIYEADIRLESLFGLTCLPMEQEFFENSVDADLCSTSSSHIDLAGAFHGYPIRLVKPSDVNHILPLKLNCTLVVDEYSICQCATFGRES